MLWVARFDRASEFDIERDIRRLMSAEIATCNTHYNFNDLLFDVDSRPVCVHAVQVKVTVCSITLVAGMKVILVLLRCFTSLENVRRGISILLCLTGVTGINME